MYEKLQTSGPSEVHNVQKHIPTIAEDQYRPIGINKISISEPSATRLYATSSSITAQKRVLVGRMYYRLNVEGNDFLNPRFTDSLRGICSTEEHRIFEKESKSEYIKPTDIVPRHIELEENEIAIVPVRELEYEDAKKEIIEYIQKVNRKVYISEIVENLWLDIGMTKQILEELDAHEKG